MPDLLTDDELRQAFLERGPAWIRAQAAAHGARAAAVPPEVAAGFRPFFGADVDRARVMAAEMSNPPFYAELRARGVDARDLLSFADGMAAITFDTTIVVAPAGLLFHPPFLRAVVVPMLQTIQAAMP